MKLFIYAALFLFSASDLHFQETNLSTFTAISADQVSTSIIMEDDIMMRADTEDTTKIIVSIEIKDDTGQTVLTITGCGDSVCLVNLSSLDSGDYEAHVTDDSNQTTTATISVGT